METASVGLFLAKRDKPGFDSGKLPSPRVLSEEHLTELRDWPSLEWPDEPSRPPTPSRRAILWVRLLVVAGVCALAAFLIWLCGPERRGDPWLFWPLVLAFGFRALCWLLEWVNYARPKFEPARAPRRTWTVDVMTTACPGEPRGMILRTLLAMKAIRLPHTDYLCDEGDDPLLRDACARLGVVHVTRAAKTDAKAGNINHALAQSTGEIVVVLDPDHEPAPWLLDRVLGHFDDMGVGFVQSVQAYRNQRDSTIADGAAKQTYLFYGPGMIGMHGYGTTQAIGANCVFRRAALDTIGGHAAGLAEDMHTTMRLYAQGWRSIYLPEVLTRGLVPATLPAYWVQQLKWSCGAFELLLREYPKLCRGFTAWQRLHYFAAPLYFLRGLVDFVSFLVPLFCLVLGAVSVRIELIDFVTMLAPVLFVSAALRHFTQRWVIEERERGFHFTGGVLATGSWWVYLAGFLCAVFGRKVPYIPTPKDRTIADCWRLAVPNLAVAAMSVGAVAYGLARDWTPFSFLMAVFALINAAQLTLVALAGQQRTLQNVSRFLARDWLRMSVRPGTWLVGRMHGLSLRWMRERSAAIAVPVLAVSLGLHLWPKSRAPSSPGEDFKDTGGFYLGVDGVEPERAAGAFDARPRLFPFAQSWGPGPLERLPIESLRDARRRGAVPLLTWTPSASAFPEMRADADLARDRGVCAAIVRGDFDPYLARFAEAAREFGDPLLIRFAPQAGDPHSAWSEAAGNTPEEYVQAWIYVVSMFQKTGAGNVGWVWCPASPAAIETHFPGRDFVDWIGLPAENRGARWREFADLYAPYRPAIARQKLPVLLTGFGSTDRGGSRADWIARACTTIARDFPEIRGLVLDGRAGGWFANGSPAVAASLRAGFARPAFRAMPPPPIDVPAGLWRERPRTASHSTAIQGSSGHFQLTAEGSPFYIRGVAYNPGHDWRDGNIPLTRRELEGEFERVREMGANTIRRYGGGWSDRNLFRVAQEKDLRILYGFWFEQEVDYLTDRRKRAAYERRVEAAVRKWRDEPNLLAWSLGNEVWGLLKHRFAQPYLTEVRHAHIDFVERLAQRVHALDPRHAVFTAHEHGGQLAGALADFATGAPSLDFTGVNSYYESRLSDLRRVTAQFDPARPYLISEFGPDGYWDARFTRRDGNGALLEPLSQQKAGVYARGWSVHAEPNGGANLGAVAYCWRDRLEATATWFGLTDSLGRPKPPYFTLQRLWKGRASAAGPQIAGLNRPWDRVSPGEAIEVRAEIQSVGGERVRCQWHLATEDFEMDVGRVRPLGDGSAVRVTLPRKPGVYRLYLAVENGAGSDAANVAITVAKPGELSALPAAKRIAMRTPQFPDGTNP